MTAKTLQYHGRVDIGIRRICAATRVDFLLHPEGAAQRDNSTFCNRQLMSVLCVLCERL